MTEQEKQVLRFEKNLQKVVKKLDNKLRDLLAEFDTRAGVLTSTDSSKALLLKRELTQALKDTGYYDLIKDTLKESSVMADIRIKELKDVIGKRFSEIDKTVINGLNKMNYGEMINISETAINSIQNKTMQSVILGTSKSVLVKELSGELDKLQNYAETYITTSKRIYSQTVEDEIAEQVGFGEDKDDIWEYVGAPLQDNSHKECIWGVPKRYFTNDEKIDFEQGHYAEGSFDPMRWNCQHNFQISDKTYEEVFGGGEDVPTFKTTKEAEQWARDNLMTDINVPDGIPKDMIEEYKKAALKDKINLEGIPIDIVNDFNKKIFEFQKKYDLPKLESYKAGSVRGDSVAEFVLDEGKFPTIQINKKFINSIDDKLDDWILKANKSGYLEGRSVSDLAHHESTHYLHRTKLAKYSSKIDDLFNEIEYLPNINLSNYGMTKSSEMFAELSTAKQTGRTLSSIIPKTRINLKAYDMLSELWELF